MQELISEFTALLSQDEIATRITPAEGGDAFSNPIVAHLRDLQRQRRFLIRTQSRMDRSTESYLAIALGAAGLPAGERKKVYGRANNLMKIVQLEFNSGKRDIDDNRKQYFLDQAHEKAKELKEKLCDQDRDVFNKQYGLILINCASRYPWDQLRKSVEDKEMRVLAQSLPVWPFVEANPGTSDLTLAVIVGESGDPTCYPDKHRLCKRLGLGIIEGKRQGNPGMNATAEDWTRHGYNRQRRSEMYVFLSDTMIRRQWCAERDGVPAHGIAPYGVIYGHQKQIYLEREWEKGHADKAARRYAAKHFIKDYRKAWRSFAI